MSRYAREWSVAGALAAGLVFLALFAPSFFQPQPLLSLAARTAPVLVVTCAMSLVLIGRQIDISAGSLFSVCSVVAGLLAARHCPVVVIVPATLLVGAVMGALNGVLVAGLGLPAIVVTLATMVTWREGLRWEREGLWVDLPERFQWFGLPQAAGQGGLILVALGLLFLLAMGLRHSAGGRFVYAVGSDAEAARLAGIPPRRVGFLLFVMAGALTGLAALLNTVQSPQVDPNCGNGLEMKAIAAAVVGGVAISGGRGSLWGALAGLLLLACVGPALTHLHAQPYWEKATQGAVILMAVVADGWRARSSGRGRGRA